jgi:hypothetical protein
MAPEYALYRWNGELMAPRPDWLDFLYHTEIKEYTVRNISARAYGDFGVVTLVCTWTGVHNGSPFDLHSVMVDTRMGSGRSLPAAVVPRLLLQPVPQALVLYSYSR